MMVAQRRSSMRSVHETPRLRYKLGRSRREIAAVAGISAGTASTHLRRAEAAAISWTPSEEMGGDAPTVALFPPRAPSSAARPEPG